MIGLRARIGPYKGVMESIVTGWTEKQGGQIEDFVTKINNCHHEIS